GAVAHVGGHDVTHQRLAVVPARAGLPDLRHAREDHHCRDGREDRHAVSAIRGPPLRVRGPASRPSERRSSGGNPVAPCGSGLPTTMPTPLVSWGNGSTSVVGQAGWMDFDNRFHFSAYWVT